MATEREWNADVVVVGGGVAGIAAAIASARQGAETILIERAGWLGGIGITGATGLHRFYNVYQVEPPADFGELASGSPDFDELLFPAGTDFRVEDMEYKVTGGNVEVYAPKKEPGQEPKKRKPQLVFAKSGGAWRLQLDPLQKEMLALIPDLGPALNKTLEAMANGVNSGEVTAANLDAKFEAITKKHMAPIMVRLMPLMMQMMAEAMGGSGGGDFKITITPGGGDSDDGTITIPPSGDDSGGTPPPSGGDDWEIAPPDAGKSEPTSSPST